MTFDAQHDLIRREARVAGIAGDSEPSLEAVAGRRAQVWTLTTTVLLATTLAIALSFGERLPGVLSLPPGLVRASVIVLSAAFVAYAVEKEIHLRRLTALLVEERVRNVVLQGEVERLLELDRIRSGILSDVRHDLMTPVESILAAGRRLRTDLPADRRRALADALERQGRELERMIDELLSASDLEREGPPLDLEPVDVPQLVRGVAADLALSGKASTVEGPALQPVRASAEGLRRVMAGLIDNAHTHGRAPVHVSIEDAGPEVIVSVRDSGPGIAEADRRRIFELFTRLGNEGTHPGLGLGLAVVPGLVATWGGRVWVDEAPEGGAAFHVALPRAWAR
jgi:signal transduction histidine kinase